MLRRSFACAVSVFLASITPLEAQTAAPEKTAEKSAQFKSADELWKHIEDLKRGPGRKFASRDEFKEYLGGVKSSVLEFLKTYPRDPRRWEAKMMNAQVSAVLLQMSGGKASGDQQEAVYKEIIAAPDAPAPVKTEARFGLLQVHLAPAIASEKLTPELEAEIAAFKKDFPADQRSAALDMMRVKFLQKSNPAKADALLHELAQSKDANVAAEAQARLKQAELMKKPLELKFTAVDGTPIDLAEMRGKVVLVDFWATWCGPCMAEVPHVVEAYKKLHPRGFEIVGISLDQDKEKLLAVTKEKGMTWPQYFDGKGWQNAISSSFGIDSIPRMWLVNKKGYVVSTEGRDDLAQQIEKLLAE